MEPEAVGTAGFVRPGYAAVAAAATAAVASEAVP